MTTRRNDLIGRLGVVGGGGASVALRSDGDLTEEHLDVVEQVHAQLLDQINPDAINDLSPAESRRAVEEVARSIVTNSYGRLLPGERDDVVALVTDEVLGLGPIDRLIRDASISEVMVNDYNEVYFERDGIIYESPIRFRDQNHVMRIIDRITTAIGRRVDEASPMVDARLADGSRVNAAIPPIVPRGPVLTIRKFRTDKYTVDQLIANNTLSPETAEFLAHCVRMRLNIVISGGTGTGKTTLLNAVSAFIPSRDRIVTIEDPTELKLQQRHVVAMEARPPNIEGRNAVAQRDLFRNSLRMRPDRIIVGEVRGSEAFDMMQAMNTGHDGSLTTVHANSPRDALARIENMVLMAGYDLPINAIREQEASALHLLVHISRMSDGSRRITHITEVTGMEGSVITLQDLFLFHVDRVTEDGHVIGSLRPTGLMPTFAERFATMGVDLSNYLLNGASGTWIR